MLTSLDFQILGALSAKVKSKCEFILQTFITNASFHLLPFIYLAKSGLGIAPDGLSDCW